MKNRAGHVFESTGKWYARLTVTDTTGKRRNIKCTAKSKSEANLILKQLIRLIDDEGTKVVDCWKVTFNDLADYYEKNFVIPVKFTDGQKVKGLRKLIGTRYFLG